jgi:undecaprenyl-diphosphatase
MAEAIEAPAPGVPPRPGRRAPALLALGALLLLAIAWAVGAHAPFDVDRAILLALRDADDPARPIGPGWLRVAMVEWTALGSAAVLAPAVLLGAGLLLVRGRQLTAALVVAATASGAWVAADAKLWVARPRPGLVDHLVQAGGYSFPSGHAANSAIVWLTLAGLVSQVEHGRATRRYTLAAAALVVATVGASRVYLGVHWPSDVLAGWLAGTWWAGLWWWIGAGLHRRLGAPRRGIGPAAAPSPAR